MNWIEESIKRNRDYAARMIPVIMNLKKKYPDEKSLDKALKILQEESFSDDLPVKIRSQLSAITAKKERELEALRTTFYEATDIEFNTENNKKIEAENCFLPGFDFQIFEGMYYLKLPKLNIKRDRLSKTENMLDTYLRNSITDSIIRYQIGRHEFECFKTFTIVFRHYFTSQNYDKYDTDNIAIEKVINGINGLLIENDTVGRSHIIQTTESADQEYTEVYIIKGHDLGNGIWKFLDNKKQLENSIF